MILSSVDNKVDINNKIICTISEMNVVLQYDLNDILNF